MPDVLINVLGLEEIVHALDIMQPTKSTFAIAFQFPLRRTVATPINQE
jgi:hypothetical protein